MDCDPQNHAALFLSVEREERLDSCLTSKKKDCREFIIEARSGFNVLPAGENLAIAVHEISYAVVGFDSLGHQYFGLCLFHHLRRVGREIEMMSMNHTLSLYIV